MITAMSRGDLSVDQLLALLKNKVRYLSAFGTKYESTVSKSLVNYIRSYSSYPTITTPLRTSSHASIQSYGPLSTPSDR